jgi:hypothetical protein
MAMKRLLVTLVVAGFGVVACAGSETVNDEGAAPPRASSSPVGVETPVDSDAAVLTEDKTATAATPERASEIDEEPETERPPGRGSTTTTTIPCVDVGTFQGCPTHGGPTPGSDEDCTSANPVGPCQPRVVLWNSSTHSGPVYGELDRAEPGQEVTALATGFPAGSEVAFCFGELNAGCRIHTVQATDASGRATLVFLVPADAPPKEYVVAVCRCVSADDEIRATSQPLAVEGHSGREEGLSAT